MAIGRSILSLHYTLDKYTLGVGGGGDRSAVDEVALSDRRRKTARTAIVEV